MLGACCGLRLKRFDGLTCSPQIALHVVVTVARLNHRHVGFAKLAQRFAALLLCLLERFFGLLAVNVQRSKRRLSFGGSKPEGFVLRSRRLDIGFQARDAILEVGLLLLRCFVLVAAARVGFFLFGGRPLLFGERRAAILEGNRIKRSLGLLKMLLLLCQRRFLLGQRGLSIL